MVKKVPSKGNPRPPLSGKKEEEKITPRSPEARRAPTPFAHRKDERRDTLVAAMKATQERASEGAREGCAAPRAPSSAKKSSMDAWGGKGPRAPEVSSPLQEARPPVPGPSAPLAPAVAAAKAAPPAQPRGDAPELLLTKTIESISSLEERMRGVLSLLERKLAAPAPVPPSERPEDGDGDEVAKAFSRAVSEVVDRKVEEIIPLVAGLHQALKDESAALREDPDPPSRDELQAILVDAVEELRKVLRLLGGGFIAPEVGEPYDPLIHLAVGELVSGDPEGTVVRVVRPGYRSSRGRVVLPARVLVGRR